ncbi:hypothetical protein F4774DRAFT_429421 [Daldinia eschscholtzii]|nr:hypothetical protein F4774DRAFT_429421 [Daldinia eschscholtzii]
MEYSFEPADSEDRRRLGVIPVLFAEILQARYERLPIELCLTIAEYVVCESAIIVNMCGSNSAQTPDIYDIDTTLSIWARYISIDGSSKDVCIFEADRDSLIDTVYTSEDHLGVKQIIFSKSDSSIDTGTPDVGDLSTWWQTISIAEDRHIRVQSDGSKIRRINISVACESDQVILWQTPMPPRKTRTLHFHSLNPPHSSITRHFPNFLPKTDRLQDQNVLRMTSLECNNGAITGLSSAWESGILYLHAHKIGEDISFYRHMDRRQRTAVWTYIPFDDGESIVSIWWGTDAPPLDRGLVVRTNKGRTVGTGPYDDFHQRPFWSRVFLASGGPDRIYWHYTERGIKKLATTSPAAKEPEPHIYSCSQVPTCARGILFSSAALQDVMEIIPCERRHETHTAITGLLIRYANESRACVGEVRLDSLCTPIRVEGPSRLYLGFAKTMKYSFPYVASIAVHPPGDRGSYEWIELDWVETLEWWYESRQCKVWHRDGESPSLSGY